MPKVTNILIVGVGGQGTVLASKLLGHVLTHAGYDVKMSEVHGMAQRGGSVVTQVRFGDKVYAPTIPEGEVDILLGFEPLETLRWSYMLAPGGRILTDDYSIVPSSVNLGAVSYPDVMTELASMHPLVIQAAKTGESLGNFRSANVLMLGVLSKMLPLEDSLWENALVEVIPKKHLEVNKRAFEKGREFANA